VRAQDPRAAEWIHARAQEIVDGLDPSEQKRGWFTRWLERLDLDSRFSDWVGAGNLPWHYLLYAVAAIVVLVLLWLLVREIDLGRRRASSGAGPAGGVRERVEELLSRARAARLAGERLGALRLYFAAYVVGLSRRGDLEFRESWTNQELVARGAHSLELRESLAPLVRELDGLVYGGRAVSDEHLDRLEGLCQGVAA